MKRFAAVALREVAERRFVLVAAAAAAVIPFLVPLLPGVPADQVVTTRSVVALVLSCAFGLGGSLLVGASVVGRELAEKRLSFHFARPLSAPVVWGGKLAGGLALVLVAEAIVLLPASVASGEFPGLPGLGVPPTVPWALVLQAVPLFLLGWVGSVALRSRSPWLVVDLVLLVLLPSVPALLLRRLVRYGHAPEPAWAISAGAVLLAALHAATFAQVAAGRTDPRRGHGAQSLTLWGVLLVATAVAAVWTERTVDPGVGRLAEAWAAPAGRSGGQVFVFGSTASGRGQTSYRLDLETGDERLLPVGHEAAASSDGSRVAIVSRSILSPKEVEVEVLSAADGSTASLGLPDWPDGIALSDGGDRLAVVSGGVCRVLAVPSLDLLASARVPAGTGWAYEPWFVALDRVRLLPHRRSYRKSGDVAPREVTDPVASELNVASKSVAAIARYPITDIPYRAWAPSQGVMTEPWFRLFPSPDHTRILVLAVGSARSIRLLEAESGRVLAAFDGPPDGGVPVAGFLADGRVVVAEWTPEGRRLAVLSPLGERVSAVPLPTGGTVVRLGHEVAPGVLAVGVRRDDPSAEWSWSLADLSGGLLRPVSFEPVHRLWWSQGTIVPPPGSPATRLAREKGSGRLVLFDPATGETKPLTRGRPARK